MYVGKYSPNNIDRSIDGNANRDGELESIEHGGDEGGGNFACYCAALAPLSSLYDGVHNNCVDYGATATKSDIDIYRGRLKS